MKTATVKTLIATFALCLPVLACASSPPAPQPGEAKISMAKAKTIALHSVHGKIRSGELEREGGKLIYSFDIAKSNGKIREVNVNAMDGKIVAIETENAAKEAAEAVQESKEKK